MGRQFRNADEKQGASLAVVAIKERKPSKVIDRPIIGRSMPIRMLKTMIDRITNSSASVMISGPSGSGKELVARAIHNQSGRSRQPFVAINCGAIPPELIESELFGHERGSFTGANARRIGRFEEADGGTLFLDEIGDMRFDMQVKLLRVLEEGVISRIGGNSPIPVDVRIISATHQNLENAICEKQFREDLFYRLGVLPISVPPLANRLDDLPLLIAHFQDDVPARDRVTFDPQGMIALSGHVWPGNVRELRNALARAMILHRSETLGREKVRQILGIGGAPNVIERSAAEPACEVVAGTSDTVAISLPIDLKQIIETMELKRIQMALDMADGVISEAARLLTLKRTTLIEKMRKYGVDRAA